ncbi:hypothetical protein ACIBH1_47265 [Nonomuraea sp. NPDC050663]|uniref:hypothetical protein n=1 Tax=Nonomuraea sp. NPDC050663 TaxID=3364370 RepID=UPI0037891454
MAAIAPAHAVGTEVGDRHGLNPLTWVAPAARNQVDMTNNASEFDVAAAFYARLVLMGRRHLAQSDDFGRA